MTTFNFIPKTTTVAEFATLKPYFETLNQRALNSVQALEQFILDLSELQSVWAESKARAYINMTCNTKNKDIVALHEHLSTVVEPEYDKALNHVQKRITTCPHFADLPDTRYLNYKRMLKRDVELFREDNVALEAKLSELDSQYQQVAGALTAIIDGIAMPLPRAQVKLLSADRAERETAWRAMAKSRLDVKDKLDAIYSQMIGLRHQMALNAGFANYRDYKHAELQRFDYTVSDVLTFHDSIKTHVLPLRQRVAEQHKRSLGVAEYMPWDTTAPKAGSQPLKPFTTGDELLAKTIRAMTKLAPEFGANLEKMKSANLFDLESRDGKAPGGYNYGLEVTGMPFIFMNAAGSQRDLETIVHEAGHAMHTFFSNSEPLIEYRNPPSELAETASMSMEFLSSAYWSEFYNDADHKRAVTEHLEDVLASLLWIATVDKFQHWVYTNPKHTAHERDDAFDSIWAEFSPGLTCWKGLETERKNTWHKQLHIFEIPFYYIEYAVAQLGALQMYRNYLADPAKALAAYKSGLALGYSKPLPEVWSVMGLTFDFSERAVGELMRFVKNLI